jgi:hypothetical protein
MAHPLATGSPLDPELAGLMEQALLRPATLVAERTQLIQHWQQRAESLRPQALAELQAIPDEPMRLLCLKNQPLVPGQERALGSFVHFPLMRELAQACHALDSKYIEEMARGFPVVGPIPHSGRWNPREAIPDLPLAELDDRAWEIRREVINGSRSQDIGVYYSAIAHYRNKFFVDTNKANFSHMEDILMDHKKSVGFLLNLRAATDIQSIRVLLFE